jgi:predicted dehydrogenase
MPKGSIYMQYKDQKVQPFGVGIIGGGYGMSTLLPAIKSINDFNVLYIARSQKSNSTYGFSDLEDKGIACASASEIIGDPLVDLVVIACPPDVQEKYAIAALENGKSIFCEKPAGLDVDATRRIGKTVVATDGFATIGYQFRYDPLIKWLCKKVSEGGLGKILKVDVQWETSGATKSSSATWRSDLERGGGVLRDFAVHVFDYMSMIDPVYFNNIITDIDHSSCVIKNNRVEADIQEVDFEAFFDSVQFKCRVSRKIVNPLGHKIRIEGENGVAQVLHKTPFGLSDMSARYWSNEEGKEKDCTEQLGLVDVAFEMEKYQLDLRQLAVRKLFADLATQLGGGFVPNLPNFSQGIANQYLVERIQRALLTNS